MATQELKNIFLSASIPVPERDPKYIDSADIIAIRDAVIALATVALPQHRIIWGGHPSITPLVYYVMEKMGLSIQEHLVLYQSKFFEKKFPKDNNKFKNVVQIEAEEDKDKSLYVMRKAMLSSFEFSAGIFIGGMEGVEDEFKLFQEFHPKALLLPIASTGAAAKIIYNELEIKEKDYLFNYTYKTLFQKHLTNKL